MNFLNRLLSVFSQSGRNDTMLQHALSLAKSNRPAEAVAIYSNLIRDSATSEVVKARALFNRALAYSSLNDDERAAADLQMLVTSNTTPENVRTAARNQLARIKNRA